MDYRIRTSAKDLDSTGYMEIGPGRYSGKHWQDGFLFIWEDAFGMAEGAIKQHFPSYDHFGMNDIPKVVGVKIARDWMRLAGVLREGNTREFILEGMTKKTFGESMMKEVEENVPSIAKMLEDLSSAMMEFYEKDDWVCVLGM